MGKAVFIFRPKARRVDLFQSEGNETMKLVYDVNQRPPLKKNLVYAFQQLLAIMAATLLVPILADSTGLYLNQPAALFGTGMGTLFYILVATRRKSPVFLGSSFAFISPLASAVAYGFGGILLGSVFAGLVYVLIALIIKKTGSEWVNKLLPPVVIGPTVALIGLSLCGSAVKNLSNTAVSIDNYNLVAILVGVLAFLITVYASVKGPKSMRMVPFIIGILGAYVIALALTLIGNATGCEMLQLVHLSAFDNMQLFKLPRFTFLGMFGVYKDATNAITGWTDVLSLFLLFAPVAFVTLAEHIAILSPRSLARFSSSMPRLRRLRSTTSANASPYALKALRGIPPYKAPNSRSLACALPLSPSRHDMMAGSAFIPAHHIPLRLRTNRANSRNVSLSVSVPSKSNIDSPVMSQVMSYE